jgi:hypothetical protein
MDRDSPPPTKPENKRPLPVPGVPGFEIARSDVRKRHPGAERSSPPPEEPRIVLDAEPQSFPRQAGRSSWAPHRDAFVGPVAKAGGAALALVLVAGATFLATQLKGCSTSPAAIAEMERKQAEQAKAIETLTDDNKVLKGAVGAAADRARNVATVQRKQAEWICSQLRMFHRIGCLVEGDPKEPPMLNLGQSPLGSGEAFVIRPPTMIIATPVPAGDKE